MQSRFFVAMMKKVFVSIFFFFRVFLQGIELNKKELKTNFIMFFS
jgi:hypothetical protein